MVVLVDWKHYLICKEMLIIFCQQFKTLPKNDVAFIGTKKFIGQRTTIVLIFLSISFRSLLL